MISKEKERKREREREREIKRHSQKKSAQRAIKHGRNVIIETDSDPVGITD